MMTIRNLKHSPRRVLMTREQRVTLQWRHMAESSEHLTNVNSTRTEDSRSQAETLRRTWPDQGAAENTWSVSFKSSTMKHKQRLRNCSRLKNSKEIWKLTVTYDVGLSLPVCDRAGTVGET